MSRPALDCVTYFSSMLLQIDGVLVSTKQKEIKYFIYFLCRKNDFAFEFLKDNCLHALNPLTTYLLSIVSFLGVLLDGLSCITC